MDRGLVEFQYTTEVGEEWQTARGDIFWGPHWSEDATELEAQLSEWAEEFGDGIDYSRRVSMLLDGGNVLPCAAVRLPNGRRFDAVLGEFDDDHTERHGNVPDPLPIGENCDRERYSWLDFAEKLEDRFFFGSGCSTDQREVETMEEKRKKQWRNQVLNARAEIRSAAVQGAFNELYDRGIIETHPDDVPDRAPFGDLELYWNQLPDEVRDLIESGRLLIIEKEGKAEAGLSERGWVVLDPGDPPYDLPPDNALSSWEIPL